MRYNSRLEKKIFNWLGIKASPCSMYDPMEQCCNDYRYAGTEDGCFCESMCPYGVNGEAHLPFSQLHFTVSKQMVRTKIALQLFIKKCIDLYSKKRG